MTYIYISKKYLIINFKKINYEITQFYLVKNTSAQQRGPEWILTADPTGHSLKLILFSVKYSLRACFISIFWTCDTLARKGQNFFSHSDLFSLQYESGERKTPGRNINQ